MKYLHKNGLDIIYIKENASASYWDEHWNNVDNWTENYTKKIRLNGQFVRWFKKYLHPRAHILEAGCGQGQFLYALHKNGFNVVGVDYAKKTVEILNREIPELQIQLGDVRDLKGFKNESFDAYYSGGVIEHFWDGYDDILSEADRVLVEGGYLFITFPFMSRSRRKMKNVMPIWSKHSEPAGFYQFALDPNIVIKYFEKMESLQKLVGKYQ